MSNGTTLPTPYDCRYSNSKYLDQHQMYAQKQWNTNPRNDPRRLMTVVGQDPESVGYYDQYGRMIQHGHVSSTTSTYTTLQLYTK